MHVFLLKKVPGIKANFIPSLVGLAAKGNVHSSGCRSKYVSRNLKSHRPLFFFKKKKKSLIVNKNEGIMRKRTLAVFVV